MTRGGRQEWQECAIQLIMHEIADMLAVACCAVKDAEEARCPPCRACVAGQASLVRWHGLVPCLSRCSACSIGHSPIWFYFSARLLIWAVSAVRCLVFLSPVRYCQLSPASLSLLGATFFTEPL